MIKNSVGATELLVPPSTPKAMLAREVQKNVKAFKQLRAAKKVPDDDKLPTLQELSLPLDAPNDTPPESSVTIVPETSDVLHDDRTDLPYEETDDTPVIVDHDVTSDTLPASINTSTDVVTNLVIMPAQVTAVRELIAETDDLNKLKFKRLFYISDKNHLARFSENSARFSFFFFFFVATASARLTVRTLFDATLADAYMLDLAIS